VEGGYVFPASATTEAMMAALEVPHDDRTSPRLAQRLLLPCAHSPWCPIVSSGRRTRPSWRGTASSTTRCSSAFIALRTRRLSARDTAAATTRSITGTCASSARPASSSSITTTASPRTLTTTLTLGPTPPSDHHTLQGPTPLTPPSDHHTLRGTHTSYPSIGPPHPSWDPHLLPLHRTTHHDGVSVRLKLTNPHHHHAPSPRALPTTSASTRDARTRAPCVRASSAASVWPPRRAGCAQRPHVARRASSCA
jgi:hypothetical protein